MFWPRSGRWPGRRSLRSNANLLPKHMTLRCGRNRPIGLKVTPTATQMYGVNASHLPRLSYLRYHLNLIYNPGTTLIKKVSVMSNQRHCNGNNLIAHRKRKPIHPCSWLSRMQTSPNYGNDIWSESQTPLKRREALGQHLKSTRRNRIQ